MKEFVLYKLHSCVRITSKKATFKKIKSFERRKNRRFFLFAQFFLGAAIDEEEMKRKEEEMAAEATEEEILRQRVMENLKHLEKLGISTISRDLLELVRREYKLLVDDTKHETYRKRSCSTGHNAEKTYTGRIPSPDQRIAAVKKAEELQSSLNPHHPSFIKPMVLSHVSSGFWLGIPNKFCKDHLSLNEVIMTLEDEKGKLYDAQYIGRRTALSGGWKAFAVAHKLEDGDALIFELGEPAKFKIHIIKAIEETRETDNHQGVDDTTVAAKATKSIKQVSQKQPLKRSATLQRGK